MSGAPAVLGIDLGGTQVKGLALSAEGLVLAESSQRTADDGSAAWRQSVELVCRDLRQVCPGANAIGLCAPGLAARDGRSISNMPGRLQGLEGLDWTDALGLPAVVLNDAHAALLGEAWQGAARGMSNVVMLTLGTGVGGAAMVDGRLLRGHLGRAGHLGHISLDPEGPPDITGTPGSLEDAIGECTLALRTGGRFRTTRDLLAAVSSGDTAATEIWIRSIRCLAAALAGLINVLDPEAIVLGGGIAGAGDALFAPLRAELAKIEWRIAGTSVPLLPAQLGNQAGAFGAARAALTRNA